MSRHDKLGLKKKEKKLQYKTLKILGSQTKTTTNDYYGTQKPCHANVIDQTLENDNTFKYHSCDGLPPISENIPSHKSCAFR